MRNASAICLGAGRFLRAVLAPALAEIGSTLVIAQPRGTSFCDYIAKRQSASPPEPSYEVDTVLPNGAVITSCHSITACGSLGVPEGREAFLRLPSELPQLRYIGVGVTEAGLVHNSASMCDLAQLLYACFKARRTDRTKRPPISVLNSDNVPFNGDVIKNHVLSCDFVANLSSGHIVFDDPSNDAGREEGVGANACSADESETASFVSWVEANVVFHNTMVDRITSHRHGCTQVPRAEPLPAKALVIEDLAGVLPSQLSAVPGVVLRTTPSRLGQDIQLKLRIANGLHTAMVYVMALSRQFTTDRCTDAGSLILPYLEQIFERDIVNLTHEIGIPRAEIAPVYSEWMARLQHPHFGLDVFFVSQNASQKLSIRLAPSIRATISSGIEAPSTFMAFAVAAMLRFLTPIGEQPRLGEARPVFQGMLDEIGTNSHADGAENSASACEGGDQPSDPAAWEYAPGLSVKPSTGTYEFADGDGLAPLLLRPLGRQGGPSVAAAVSIVSQVLATVPGCEPHANPKLAAFARDAGGLLHRMLNGEKAMDVLASLEPRRPLLLQPRMLAEAVAQEVDAAEVIDVHTHLFAHAYGTPLMQYGIDALLTFQQEQALACSPELVAQYLASSPEDAEAFKALPQSQQAERVWQALFVERSPLSEHCRGIVSSLNALGLAEELASRDLGAIRKWYSNQAADMFTEKVMRLSKIKYVVSSHSPFFAHVQLQACLHPPPRPPRYHAALEIDALLEGDWDSVIRTLSQVSEPLSLRGVSSLLSKCTDALQPEYISTSTPQMMTYSPTGIREREAELQAALDAPLKPPPPAALILDAVILPLCLQKQVPLLLRMGTRRGLNPPLGLAGDGVGSAGLDALATLCFTQPKMKFLATVLCAHDQHEIAVLASRFRNLHLWGCWWYSHIPSVIASTTALRLELLGPNFSFLASSARIHDQLIYKWKHGRSLLTRMLTAKYEELVEQGWRVSRGDIRRDVQRLLGGAYEEFLHLPL